MAHHIWTQAEVWAVIDDAIARRRPGPARAVALARFAGLRRGSLCAIPLFARIKDYDKRGDLVRCLYWITEKRLVLADMRDLADDAQDQVDNIREIHKGQSRPNSR